MNDYQKKQREKTIAAVNAAAERLQKRGVTLTLRGIAEEADLSVSTVANKEIKYILYRDFPIGKKAIPKDDEIHKLQEQLNQVKNDLKHSQKVNNQLRLKVKCLQEERDSINLKYRQLLLQYAINIDQKIMPL